MHCEGYVATPVSDVMHKGPSTEQLAQLRKFRRRKFNRARVLNTDALVAFLPSPGSIPAEVEERKELAAEMRLYPAQDGYWLKWPYDGSSFDPNLFHVESGGWDHEHCSSCNATIGVNKVCWITERGSFVILCDACHRQLDRL